MIANGMTYLINEYHTWNKPFLTDDPWKNSSSKMFLGTLCPTKYEIKNAPRGSPMLLTRKSAASKTGRPPIVISDSKPNDKAEGIPNTKMIKPAMTAISQPRRLPTVGPSNSRAVAGGWPLASLEHCSRASPPSPRQ
jgi:hypothetical protein